jgi:hypothetical protein
VGLKICDQRRANKYFGATVCASPPPEIHKPSEISEAFQEVVTSKFLEVVPEAFIVSGPRL